MSSQIVLKASGLNISTNQLSAGEGSLSLAKNVIIKRDNVIESRRGYKLYGDEFGTGTDRAKQLFSYKERILRHFQQTLQFDNGSGTFSNFAGSYVETETGLRIKSIESNGNFYFTTSEGIKKISAKTASDFSTSEGYITEAGGIKAIDVTSRLNIVLGDQTSFLPQDSAVAYRVVWGITDANGNLILGVPSQRSEIYNPLIQLELRDFANLLDTIDKVSYAGGGLVSDTDYVSLLGLPISASANELKTGIIEFCFKLDTDIEYTSVVPTISSQRVTTSIGKIVFSGDMSTYVQVGGHIGTSTFTTTDFNAHTGTIVSIDTTTLPNDTVTFSVGVPFTTTDGAPVPDVGGTVNSYNYQFLVDDPSIDNNPLDTFVIDTPTPDAELVVLQNRIDLIFSTLKNELSSVIPTSSITNYVDLLNITTTASVDLTIQIPSQVTSSYFYQIYRSEIAQATGTTVLTDLVPSDELQLVFEGFPTTSELLTGIINVTDITPDAFRGANLYSNESSGEGASQTNEVPPFAKDINTFKGSVFYANTKTKQQKLMSLLGVSNLTSDQSQFVISDGVMSDTYTFVSGMKEITDITFVNEVTGNYTGKYFKLHSANDVTNYYIWYKVSGSGTDPNITDYTGVEVDIDTADTANTIAQKTKDAIASQIADFSVEITSLPTIRVTNVLEGYCTDASQASSVVIINVVQQGRGEKVSQEQFEVSCTTDVGGGSAGKYFTFSTAFDRNRYYVWFKVSGSGSDPMIAGHTGIEVDFVTNSSGNTIADAIKTKLAILGTVDVFSFSNTVNIKSLHFGPATDADAGTSGYVIVKDQDGALEVLLSSEVSVAKAVENTAKSIVSVINKNTYEIVYAFYLSGATTVPGKFLLEAKSLSTNVYYMMANDAATGASFSPDISPIHFTLSASAADPTVITASQHGLLNGDKIVIAGSNSVPSIDGLWSITVIDADSFSIPIEVVTPATVGAWSPSNEVEVSENQTKPNRVYYSKLQQPEAVPALNFFDVGAFDKQILRIFPMRDSLFVFKEDGLYRISGEGIPFSLALFDSSCVLIASDSVAIVGNLIYCWTTQGVVVVSESGVQVISRPIDIQILKLGSNQYPNFKTATWGLGYESDNSYTVYTVNKQSDTIATVGYRYSNLTSSWTTFDKTDTCGIVFPLNDTSYLGCGDTNFIEIERKTFSRLDYADREFPVDLQPGNYTFDVIKIRLNEVTGIAKGDVLLQQQYVTNYLYNMLLKKLDSDPDVGYNDYYSTLVASSGNDIRLKLADSSPTLGLASKLDQDPGINDSDYLSTIQDISGISIVSSSFSNPTVITTSSAHGLFSGRIISINGHVGSLPDINGDWEVTVLSPTTFTIPIAVTTPGTGGTLSTLNENINDIKACFNKITSKLNADVGVSFSNYLPANDLFEFETIITNVNINTREITIRDALEFQVGTMTVFKAISTEFLYSPVTMGNVMSFKHVREATIIFNNKAFTSATLSFATDLLPEYIPVEFNASGNGIFGMDTFGNGFFGGYGNAAPFRTYIPRNAQRCRYMSIKFDHQTAREDWAYYGLTLTFEQNQIPERAYR